MPETVSEDGARGTATANSVYEAVLAYFNKRKNSEEVLATDAELEKLGMLLFSKREVGFAKDRLAYGAIAARIIEARRSYAERYNIPMASVTKATLEHSRHGLQGWIDWARSSGDP